MQVEKIISKALREDLGFGDITTDNLFDKKHKSTAEIIAGEDLVLCGASVAGQVFSAVDNSVKIKYFFKDGGFVKKGGVIMQVKGKTRGILNGERTALNFLQRLSGISTMTNRFVKIAKKYGVKVADTRKSLPGFRYLDKYAVRCGGGHNHRMNLADGVMIKDNHIKARGGITKAVETIKGKIPHAVKIEVETKTLAEVRQALKAKADIIMLDNMTPKQILNAKKIINKKALIEVSGGITLENLEVFAKLGPDIISIGALTHSVRAVDISLDIKKGGHNTNLKGIKRGHNTNFFQKRRHDPKFSFFGDITQFCKAKLGIVSLLEKRKFRLCPLKKLVLCPPIF